MDPLLFQSRFSFATELLPAVQVPGLTSPLGTLIVPQSYGDPTKEAIMAENGTREIFVTGLKNAHAMEIKRFQS
jgi:hypothetical protein